MTLLDAIMQSLSLASEYNRDDQTAAAVILWPDKERQWAQGRPDPLPCYNLGKTEGPLRSDPLRKVLQGATNRYGTGWFQFRTGGRTGEADRRPGSGLSGVNRRGFP